MITANRARRGRLIESLSNLRLYSETLFAEIELEGHSHQVFADRRSDGIEGGADMLAESVANCSPDKHDGHGRHHSHEDIENAYKEAIKQFLTRDVVEDFVQIRHKILMYQKWGGHMPGFMVMPNAEDPNKWQAMAPDEEGNPVLYDLKGNPMDLADPRETKARPDDTMGWKYARRRRVRQSSRSAK